MSRLGLLAAVLLSMTATAGAQTSPRVLVIFDTSGSMLWDYPNEVDCQGDGSREYPHRGACVGVGSRMFHAKEALSQVVRGAGGVEFGLMRYGQLEPGDAGFGDRQHLVGAQYRDANGAVVASNYDGASNGCGPADMLVSPGPAARAEVLEWMDQRESYPGDKELRANGYTPLTQSMESARQQIAQLINRDPEAACRPYYVLLLTDGYQQCPNVDARDPAFRAQVRRELVATAEQLRDLPVGGQRHDVRTFVVGFGPGTEFASELDALARAGGTAVDANGRLDLRNGTAYQANDPRALIESLQDAVDNAQPRELCDGLDNDCDGDVDEGFPQLGRPCSVGVGLCGRDGEIGCADDGEGAVCDAVPGDPQAEVCNGDDDDCDGQVDEGVTNRCGACGPEPAEVCNDQDDDCDGAVDEGVRNRCGGCGELPVEVCNGRDDDCDDRVDEGALNACGACGDVPVERCNCEDDDCDNLIDEGLNNCPPCDCDPQPEVCNEADDDCDNEIDEGQLNACGRCGPVPEEVCNGLDDDCDGRVDESFPEEGQACGDDAGECSTGTWRCTAAGDLECGGGVGPEQEVCDKLDNDCDGEVDEGAANACGYCGPTRVEVCDNIDNDCDGADDNGVSCREDTQCVNGECAPPCEVGECFNDLVCVRGVCVTPCFNRDCPAGWVCQDGVCSDPCVGIECPDSTYCTLGRCEPDDCYGPAGCAEGQMCRNGGCVPDPCAEADCAPGQGCVNGLCFDDCGKVDCQPGEVCENGVCREDPCARVSCPYPQVCEDGACVEDPCFEVDCPLGHICDGGSCVEDPCLSVRCPEGAMCHRGVCVGDGVQVGDRPGVDAGARADAGVGQQPSPAGDDCNCRADAGGRARLVWLLFLGLALPLRRRRRR